MIPDVRLVLARVPRWTRLLAALTCLLLAGVSAVDARARHVPAAPGVPVVVAARTMPAGHLVMGRDVRVASWPASVHLPSGLARRSAVVGRRLATPVVAGEPVTAGRLVGASLTAGLAPGTAAVPVQLARRSAAEFVHPGDRIDLVAAPPQEAANGTGSAAGAPAASGVQVLAVLPASDDGALVVVATDRATARRLAQLGSSAPFLPIADPALRSPAADGRP